MSRLMHSLKIGARIGVAIGVLGLAFLVAAGQVLKESNDRAATMAQLRDLATFVTQISNLVHEVQKERGASAVFVGSKGAQLGPELAAQRLQVDRVHVAFDDARGRLDPASAGPSAMQALADALDAVGQLPARRQAISQFAISAPESNAYFTSTIGKLIDVAIQLSTASSNADVTNAISAYTSFMLGKERAGQERASGAAGIAVGKFEPVVYRRFVSQKALQDSYFTTFKALATPGQRALFDRTMAAEVVTTVDRMRQIAYDGGLDGRMDGVQGAAWYQATTARINLLKTVEDALAADLNQAAVGIEAAARRDLEIAGAVVGATLLAALGLALLIVRDITRPLLRLSRAMQKLGAGDLEIAIPGHDRGDEIGQIARSVDAFKRGRIEAERLRAEQVSRDEQALATARRQAMVGLADTLERTVEHVVDSVFLASTDMRSSAEALTTTTEEASSRAAAVAAAAEQMSRNVQTVAAASEELASSTVEIGRQVAHSSRIAGVARAAVDDTNRTVAGLADAAQRIGAVIQLISDIAGQTNLLALNATIEAARAGAEGKGFAVVAAEVKALATQTARATGEVAEQVSAIRARSGEAVVAMQRVGDIVGEMNAVAGTIAAAVEAQGTATQDIARNVQQAAAGTSEVTANIHDISAAAGRTGSAAHHVLTAAGALATNGETLRAAVTEFVGSVRAA